ncbi:MAG: class II aldolase/adducin family protein [Candidatus Coatesbacteria bacterium]
MRNAIVPQLVRLAREIGREDRGLAILGEGNVSADAGDGTFWVKASGTRMGAASPKDYLRASTAKVLRFLRERGTGREEDAVVMAGLRSCVVGPRQGQPSTETFIHALCLTEGRAKWVGHLHPTATMGLLCSRQGAKPFLQGLFPDEIVYCGLPPAVIPYVDPGAKLAYAVRDAIRRHLRRHGMPPRLILELNHGILVLGQTMDEVVNISLMTEKWARVLLGTIAAGGPRFLSPRQARHIDRWPAEHYRRKLALRSPLRGHT